MNHPTGTKTGSSMQKPTTVQSIQVLRGVAAMLVVLYHAAQLQSPVFDHLPHKAGRFGVDLFFVISAFIMVVTTEGRRVHPWDFLRRRFIRIVPLYWLATFVAVLFVVLAPGVLKGVTITLPHLLGSLFFVPHPNPANPEAIAPLYRLGWTLNFEMYFYALLALALWLVPARRIQFVSVCVLGMVVLRNLGLIEWIPLAFLGSNIALEFVFGMLLARIWLDGRLPGLPPLVAVLVFGAALAAPFLLEFYNVTQPRGVIFGLPAVLMTWAALSLEPFAARRRWALAIGDASYSLYLSHLFLLAAMAVVWPLGPMAFVLAGLILCPLLALVVFHGIERPLLDLMRSKRHIAQRAAT